MSTECAYLWYDYLIMESHEMIVGSNLLERRNVYIFRSPGQTNRYRQELMDVITPNPRTFYFKSGKTRLDHDQVI